MVSSISVSSSSMIEPQAEESKGLLAEVMQAEQSASNNRFSNPDNSNTSMRSSNRVSTNFSERFASRRKEIQKKQEEDSKTSMTFHDKIPYLYDFDCQFL